jgi:hypothetical protein
MSSYVANANGPIDVTALDHADFEMTEYMGTKDGTSGMNLQQLEEMSNNLKERFWGPMQFGISEMEGSNLSAGEHIAHARPDQHLDGFDIYVTYGVPFQQTRNTNSTLRVVKDVRIIGFGQTVSIDGEPIIETYPFIAREVL